MRVLKVGLAGLGNAGFQVHGEVLRHMEDVRLHAVTDPAPRLREEAERRYGCRACATFEELLADPQIGVVTIATPHHLHRPMALQALAAGKHVLVEKAMCLDAAEAAEMFDAARAAGRLLTVYQNWRRMPDARLVRDTILDGAPLEVPPEQALALMRTLDAVREASRSGRPASLEPMGARR